LHVAERDQDVFFAWEVVEECTFADIGRVRDVFHRGFRETLLCKQPKCGPKQSFPSFGAAALAPVGTLSLRILIVVAAR
jgi:hypothetical protein